MEHYIFQVQQSSNAEGDHSVAAIFPKPQYILHCKEKEILLGLELQCLRSFRQVEIPLLTLLSSAFLYVGM